MRIGKQTPSAVSSPTIPGGASSSGCSLSAAGCGAWSVAMASIVPSTTPSMSASTSAFVRSGGLTLNTRVVAAKQLVGEAEVVRGDLGRDADPVGLGPANELDAAGRREVQEVDRRAGEPRQLDVAVDHQLLGERRPAGQAELAAALPFVHHGTGGEGADLAMLGEDDVEAEGVLHRPAHQQRVLHAGAVVGEQVDAGVGELAERGELLAGAADR